MNPMTIRSAVLLLACSITASACVAEEEATDSETQAGSEDGTDGPDEGSASASDEGASGEEEGGGDTTAGGTDTGTTTNATTGTETGDPTDTDGETEGATDSDSDSDTDTDGIEGCEDVPLEGIAGAIAIRRGDLPEIDPGGEEGGGSGGGGDDGDPEDLMVFVEQLTEPTCEDPYAFSCEADSWGASFIIPPEFQAPGAYLIGDEVEGFYGLTSTENGECNGGGGGGFDGVLEIVSIAEDSISIRVCGTNAPEAPVDGAFEAVRCSTP